ERHRRPAALSAGARHAAGLRSHGRRGRPPADGSRHRAAPAGLRAGRRGVRLAAGAGGARLRGHRLGPAEPRRVLARRGRVLCGPGLGPAGVPRPSPGGRRHRPDGLGRGRGGRRAPWRAPDDGAVQRAAGAAGRVGRGGDGGAVGLGGPNAPALCARRRPGPGVRGGAHRHARRGHRRAAV
ncbi:MAG: hypothetical protein AVDCRST_MAG89-1625, partial [uncultured Gemmatimonadetes bacterium]